MVGGYPEVNSFFAVHNEFFTHPFFLSYNYLKNQTLNLIFSTV